MTSWSFVALGKPAPQGSKRHVGHGVMIEQVKALRPWRDTVTAAAYGAGEKLAGPLHVVMVFSMPRPKSAPKSRQYPDGRPDLSKLVRAVEDSITDAGLWSDDAQVVSLEASKVFARQTSSDDGMLPVCGVVVWAGQIRPGEELFPGEGVRDAAWPYWKSFLTKESIA